MVRMESLFSQLLSLFPASSSSELFESTRQSGMPRVLLAGTNSWRCCSVSSHSPTLYARSAMVSGERLLVLLSVGACQ
jgi:hypothetical protein